MTPHGDGPLGTADPTDRGPGYSDGTRWIVQ